MTTTAFTDIEIAFQAKLKAISGAPTIEFQGMKPHVPAVGTRYWRTNHLPGLTQQITADALRQHKGIYQVDIICPDGKGLKQMLLDMDSISGDIDTVTSLEANNTKLQIDGVARGQITREDNGWLFGFVRIYYTCYSY